MTAMAYGGVKENINVARKKAINGTMACGYINEIFYQY
jgi:hypothetical protein